MENVIDLKKLILPSNTILLKAVSKKTQIIMPNSTAKDPLFSHYVIVLTNSVVGIEGVEEGDIVVAASGIGSEGGFNVGDDTYIIVSGFNIKAVVKPDNFKFE